jgi:archaetidylinositol phosphate synthase
MLEEKRENFKKIGEKIGETFSNLGLTANQYTLISLGFAVVSFYFLIKIKLFLALLSFLAAGFLDLIDGAVARKMGKATKKGAYMDTICDRYVEGIILVGFLFLPLPNLILPTRVWIGLAFFGSLMTTYAKAAAKEKELVIKELRKGLVGRGERIILISLTMLLGSFNLFLAIYPIIILAIFSNITALQRIYLTLNQKKLN